MSDRLDHSGNLLQLGEVERVDGNEIGHCTRCFLETTQARRVGFLSHCSKYGKTALRQTNGIKGEAARLLKVTRKTLYNRMKKLNLE